MHERQTALLAVITYSSSSAFVSPVVVTKYDQLALSPCLWALFGIVKTFRLGQIQDNPARVWLSEGGKTQGKERQEET